MTDFETYKDILKNNGFVLKRQKTSHTEYFLTTVMEYIDDSNRVIKLKYQEYFGGAYNYFLKIVTYHHVFIVDDYCYFLDGKEIDKKTFIDKLTSITKPTTKQLSIFDII